MRRNSNLTLTFHEEVLSEVENGSVRERQLTQFFYHVLASLSQSLHELRYINDATTPIDLLNARVDDAERSSATDSVTERMVEGVRLRLQDRKI